MVKPRSDQASTKRTAKTKIIAIFAGVILVLYLIGLVNPITSMQFQYPYYEFFCGHKPIIAHSFMVKRYYTSDQKSYQEMLGVDGQLFCSETEAQKAGFQKSPAP
jgi:hypothetical protein